VTTAYIALGSNLGDKLQFIETALKEIEEIPETQIASRSGFKEYPAEAPSEGQEPFLNGVIRIETDLMPLELLHKLQVIERKIGRSAKGDGSPRPIDLDVLSYGDEIMIQGKSLNIPHPRLAARRFVLEPLAEIEPEWRHPKLNQTARELLEALNSGQ